MDINEARKAVTDYAIYLQDEILSTGNLYQSMKDKLLAHVELFRKKGDLDPDDYVSLVTFYNNFIKDVNKLRMRYRRGFQEHRNQNRQMPVHLLVVPSILHKLDLYLDKMDKLRNLLIQKLNFHDEEYQNKKYNDFVDNLPQRIVKIRESLDKTFKEGTSAYSRADSVIRKCEAIHTHIEKLVRSAIGISPMYVKLDESILPEGLLMHPENFSNQGERRVAMMTKVLQYVNMAEKSIEHGKEYDFFDLHTGAGCFEGEMTKLEEWYERTGLLEADKTVSLQAQTRQGKVLLFIRNHPILTNENLTANEEFQKLLGEFIDKRMKDLGDALNTLGLEESIDRIIEEIPNDEPILRMKLLVYRYLIDVLCSENIQALDELWLQNAQIVEKQPEPRRDQGCIIL